MNLITLAGVVLLVVFALTRNILKKSTISQEIDDYLDEALNAPSASGSGVYYSSISESKVLKAYLFVVSLVSIFSLFGGLLLLGIGITTA